MTEKNIPYVIPEYWMPHIKYLLDVAASSTTFPISELTYNTKWLRSFLACGVMTVDFTSLGLLC